MRMVNTLIQKRFPADMEALSVPKGNEVFADNLMQIALKSEDPRVRKALADRARNNTDIDALAYITRTTVDRKKLEWVSQLAKKLDAESVTIDAGDDFPVRFTVHGELNDGSVYNTEVVLAPQIEDEQPRERTPKTNQKVNRLIQKIEEHMGNFTEGQKSIRITKNDWESIKKHVLKGDEANGMED